MIGEGPGHNEVAVGRPFIGASGQMVNKALQAVRRPRDQLWVSNATLCLPSPNATDDDKKLARKCCEPRFRAEINQWPDRPVLALGAIAARAFLGSRFSINEMAGSYHFIDKPKWGTRAVIPTIHPAAILRGGAGIGGAHAPDLAFWNLIYDMAKIDAIAAGKDIVFREDDIATEYEDPKRAEELVRQMVMDARACGMVATDTETYVEDERRFSALQPLNAQLSAIGLATEGWGLSVAWSVMTPYAKRLVGSVFADLNVRKVMHNRLYDRPVLERHGMPVYGQCDDTMLMHHSAFPGLSHNLQRVATQYYAITPWKAEFRKGHDTPENLTRYNAKDTLVTARIYAPLSVAIKKTQSERTYDVDLRSTECAQWMHEVGVPISRQVNQELYDVFLENMTTARKVIEEAAAAPNIRMKLWDRLAFEQAKRYRHGSLKPGDPPSHKERQKVRLSEIQEAHKKGYWRFSPGSAPHARALCKIFGVRASTTKTGRFSVARSMLAPHRNTPAIGALYDYRTSKDPEVKEAARQRLDAICADPQIQAKLWDEIAYEQAYSIRKESGTHPDPDDFEERHKVRLQEIRDLAAKGKWEWRIGSSEHVVAYLKARGVPMYFLTPTGKTSTKKEILEQFAHLPEVRSLLDYRENQKMFSTFCYRMFDRYDNNGKIVKYGYADENDRIHPRWSVHKITGRWGAEDPMAQNWPKADKKKGRPNLRSQVVAPPGRIFVGFDFAQLEARIIALYSGDPFLCDVFWNHKDIHSEFARVVWPNYDTLPIDIRKKLRDTIKRPEYGAFYGGQVDTLWKNVVKDFPDVKLQDIARMVELMTAKMPGVTLWHNKLLRDVAVAPHEIRSAVYGRRRCFPLGNADINDVYNFPVQSTGADIMATGLFRIMERLKSYDNAFPILQIHDAMVFECYEEDAERLKEDVRECFEQEHTHNGVTIPFPVDPEIGRSWADV